MEPIPAALAVGALTTLGKWTRGETMSIDTVVGVVGIGLALVIITQVNESLGKGFAALAVVAVVFAQAPSILKAANGVVSSPRPVPQPGNRPI